MISLAQARAEAKRILAEKTLGKIRPDRIAFDDAKSQFLKDSARRNRLRTVRDYTRLLGRHFPYGRTALADISPQQILTKLRELSDRPSERHHAFTAVRVFFRWCVQQHYLDRSPVENMDTPPNTPSRSHILSDDELRRVLLTAQEVPHPFGPIVQLLILTGQRRSEIGQLQWNWIDQDEQTITLPASVCKNNREHTLPYGTQTAEIFAVMPHFEPYLFPASRDHVRGVPTTVFNGWPKSTERFRRQCQVDFRLHDLRRVFSSGMAALGVPQVVVEKLLNHVSGGTQSPISQIYNRYSYMPEMRQAVAAWDDRLVTLTR